MIELLPANCAVPVQEVFRSAALAKETFLAHNLIDQLLVAQLKLRYYCPTLWAEFENLPEEDLLALTPGTVTLALHRSAALTKRHGAPPPTAPCWAQLLAALAATVSRMTDRQVTVILWSLGALHTHLRHGPALPPGATRDAVFAELLARIDGLSGRDVSIVIRGVADTQCSPPAALAAALVAAARGTLHDMSLHSVCNLLSAFEDWEVPTHGALPARALELVDMHSTKLRGARPPPLPL